MLTLSRRYREHSLQPPSLELTGDYTAQINEDVGYKQGCCTKKLQRQETLSVYLYPDATGGFPPSPHPERQALWTAFPRQRWIAPFISSQSVQKSMHTLKNVTAPLPTHYVSKDSAFTTAASTGKCINTRYALYCKFTWAIKYKLGRKSKH